MASSYLQSLLGERERVLLVARQHWIILARNIAFEVFLILLFLAVTVTAAVLQPMYAPLSVAVGFLLILLPVVSLLRDVLVYTHHQFVITNRRVIHLTGVLNKNVTDSSLEKSWGACVRAGCSAKRNSSARRLSSWRAYNPCLRCHDTLLRL